LTASDAGDLAAKLFPGVTEATPAPKASPFAQSSESWDELDDWGLPKVGDKVAASVAQALNLPPPGQPVRDIVATPKEDPDEAAKKQRRAKNAKSLMDLGGIAFAAGDVMLGRKLCEAVDKEPVTPDPKQVNDLRDSFKETLTEWFGDSEISPWKMTLLLAIGIPISMLIQSKRKPKKVEAAPASTGPTTSQQPLKSVP